MRWEMNFAFMESSEGLGLRWDLVTVGKLFDPETQQECH